MSATGILRSAATSLIFAVLAMSGCATMDKSECLAVDWKTIGYEDGVAGRSGDRIAEHRKACARYGVTPDLESYQVGRRQGLREYCSPQHGFQLGERGGSYGGICPGDLEGAFVGAYESGRQLYLLESRVASATSHLGAAHRELEQVEHEIVEQSAVIVSGTSTSEARAQALLSTKELAERAGRLHSEIADLERDQARSEQDLQQYRAAIPPGG
jgi:uncharacterized small protein (DUF1192 family)